MPGRAVDTRFVARVDVQARAASPFLAARRELRFDDTFGAESDLNDAVQALTRRRHEDAGGASRERGRNFGLSDDLRKMGRTDFFLSFGDEHEVDGKLSAGAA